VVFSLFGFQVRVQPSFFLMAAVLGMPREFSPDEVLRLVMWVAVVTVSILLHELGHAFAARGMGGVVAIELYALGGVVRHTHERALTWARRAWVSFAGPLAGITLGALVFFAGYLDVVRETPLLRELWRQLLWVNLGWGALNLLPMLPLDGGHILNAVLDALTGGKGARATRIISAVAGAACVGAALWFKLYWAAFLAGWCAVAAVRSWKE
jgi:Zn-dependent protease